ncbi:aromatic amino acid hydroxylase [Niabella sp. 22666]|uniref:aromatic amino acid hydroxylase n=1 Tax=Niabella sp. 22666 TaxID=3453954 RepID=UPI003F86907B
MNNYNNVIIDRLPRHLRQYIVPQHYHHYTPVDHAVWRYVMRQNYNYLKDVAYYPYIPGLKKAGLSIEHIPDLQTMNDHLKQIGWGAVTVNGFIPSQAFMEFQAYRVLIIAADIRQIEHIEYTPAPDIIHESAGHAPIIGEPEYARYLQFTGEVGTKAMSSKKDHELFEAIRKLAVLKELAGTGADLIKQAEEELLHIQANMGQPSEMALLARLHWWTVEYGLIGDLDHYKIYGAGLLSSIGESVTCMKPDVKKIMYTLDAVNYAYDITQPQPQLFVTPNFANLVTVLDEFADSLSYRTGGALGLRRAIECGMTCTAVYSSGLQVSGVFVGNRKEEHLAYIQTKGATALAVNNKELEGHGKAYHKAGFGSPVGKLINTDKPIEACTISDLRSLGIEEGQSAVLPFTNGLEVKGVVGDILLNNDKIILIRFTECEVKDTATGQVLFEPTWGRYDMAVGEKIISVFAGAADKDAFEQVTLLPKEMPVSSYSDEQLTLHQLYQQVRNVREGNAMKSDLVNVWAKIKANHPHDWLCAIEILELVQDQPLLDDLRFEVEDYLQQLKTTKPELAKLINDGLNTMNQISILPGVHTDL